MNGFPVMTKALRALVIVWLSCVTAAWAQDEHERENLTDLREVNVVVGDVDEDVEAAGLDRRQTRGCHRTPARGSRRCAR